VAVRVKVGGVVGKEAHEIASRAEPAPARGEEQSDEWKIVSYVGRRSGRRGEAKRRLPIG